MNNKEQPIMCDLTVFSAQTRKEIAAIVPDLFKAAQAVQELPEGYAFQFPNEPGMFMRLATFVEHERQCCPFFHFALEAAPNGGPFWLQMSGNEEVKAFMQTVWGDLPAAVSRQLIQTGPGDELAEVVTEAAPILASKMAKGVSTGNDNK